MKGIFIVGFTGYIGQNILEQIRKEGLDDSVRIGGFNRKGYKRDLSEDGQTDVQITRALLDFASDLEDICILNVAGTTSHGHNAISILEYTKLNQQINSLILNNWKYEANCNSCLYIMPNSVGIFGLSPKESCFSISSILRPYNDYTTAKADDFKWCKENSERLRTERVSLCYPVITNVYGGVNSPSTLLHGRVATALREDGYTTVYNSNALRDFVKIDSVVIYIVGVMRKFLFSSIEPKPETGFLGSGEIRTVASLLRLEFGHDANRIKMIPAKNVLNSCPDPSDILWLEQ